MLLKVSHCYRGPWLLLGVLLLVAASESFAPAAKAQGPDPSEVGQWSSPVLWPLSATHTVVLSTGNVFWWAGFAPEAIPYTWDPATDTLTPGPHPGFDVFCAGHNVTADGKVLVTGGNMGSHGASGPGGNDNASYYDPVNDSWIQLPDMTGGRWYPTNTLLPNGDILVTSGTDEDGNLNKLPQVLQVASGTWRNLTNAQRGVPTYPQMFVAPNGRVFMSGPSQATRYLNPRGKGAWSDQVLYSNFGDRAGTGTAVMYDDGKVLIAGGGRLPGVPTATAEVIDLNAQGSPWRYVAPMAEPRRSPNSTLLPDGKVLVTGGHKGAGALDCNNSVYLTEMWDPQSETWSNMASAAICRTEHSTAVLLPDGRILSAGGDAPPPLPSPKHREIYSPPYLFKGARPTITSAPAAVGYGETFFVETPDGTTITNVNWLALGANTHSLNMGQRINRLTFSQAPGGLNVTAPSSKYLCPPGYYMLFILTGDGVPSVGSMLRIN